MPAELLAHEHTRVDRDPGRRFGAREGWLSIQLVPRIPFGVQGNVKSKPAVTQSGGQGSHMARLSRKKGWRLAVVLVLVLLLGLPSLLGGTRGSPGPYQFGPAIAAATSPYRIELGNVSTSYLTDVYIPVYLIDGKGFSGLAEEFAYNPRVLEFAGTVTDVASANLTLESAVTSNGIVTISSQGSFTTPSANTTLYYLVFAPVLQEQVRTTVLLQGSLLGGVKTNGAASTVSLARGWSTFGPTDIPFALGGCYRCINFSASGAGVTNAVGFSPNFPDIIYEGSGSRGLMGPLICFQEHPRAFIFLLHITKFVPSKGKEMGA